MSSSIKSMTWLWAAVMVLLECAQAAGTRRQLQQGGFIGNGEDAPCGRYPYMVSLQDNTSLHKCGGVLVDKEWVLTAAHCVDPESDGSLGLTPVIVIGACNLEDTENENGLVEKMLPHETIIHEGWTGNVTNGNDIALLKLSQVSKHIPAGLPVSGHTLAGGARLTALGWGSQERSSTREAKRLQQALDLDFIRASFCNDSSPDAWSGIITDTMVCAAGLDGQEVCQGDSGGALIQGNGARIDLTDGEPSLDIVIGITSFGEKGVECGQSVKPQVFTKIESFRPWINGNLKDVLLPPPTSFPSPGQSPISSPTATAGLPMEPQSPLAPSPGPAQRKMYWASSGDRKIQRANLDGTEVEDLPIGGLSSPEGIAVDLENGMVYWTDGATGKIQRANLDGTRTEGLVTTGLSQPEGITLDVAGGKVYWTDEGSGKIQRANLNGSEVEDVVTGLISPEGIALDIAEAKMYWVDFGTHKIQRSDTDGSNIEDLIVGGFSWLQYMALDVRGGKMYWTDWSAQRVQRADLDGLGIEDLVSTGGPVGIALELEAGKLYWTDWGAGKILCANLDGSETEELVTGLNNPEGLAL